MVWSHFTVAFDEGLAAARGWAAEHGHLLAPTEATWENYPIGTWLKNQRAAARRAEDPLAKGQQAGSGAGGLSRERRRALEEIDPAWCPAWPVAWQRCFHLARMHRQTGGSLPEREASCWCRARTSGAGCRCSDWSGMRCAACSSGCSARY
ncbi:helicase associated domain-containing protein [Streptomyces sp. NPDC046862]|uniref:helicase associated domain-containing protein n=1 Tax=Streptomyces sp. NPDC046862 TaxID=3154603 RepID=UPI0034535331